MNSFLKLGLAYKVFKQFGDKRLLNDFYDFISFAEKKFPLVGLDPNIEDIALVFELLENNLDNLENGTFNERNFVDIPIKNYIIKFESEYKETVRYEYDVPYKAPSVRMAEKMFSYEIDDGSISPEDDGKLIKKVHLDTDFIGERLVGIKDAPSDIQETTKRIVRELLNKKLNR